MIKYRPTSTNFSQTLCSPKKFHKQPSITDGYLQQVNYLRTVAKETISNKQVFRNFSIKRRTNSSLSNRPKFNDQHSIILSNFSQAKKRSEMTRFRMLIDKKVNTRKNMKSSYSVRAKNSFDKEKSYQELYKQYLKSPNQNKNHFSIEDDEQDLIPKSCEITKKMSGSADTIQNGLQSHKSSVLEDKEEDELTKDYEYLASKTIHIERDTPGEVIYKHFSIKYRDYTNLKRKQLQNVTSKFNKFHKQQKKILGDMYEKGISEENQFRMISKIYQTFLLMNGRIKDSQVQDKGPNLQSFKKQFKKAQQK